MAKKRISKKKIKKFVSITDVRCPVCKGDINEKWFNFRSGNVIEFIAECWQPRNNSEEPYPRHIFYFQIEVPEANDGGLYPAKGSKVFRHE